MQDVLDDKEALKRIAENIAHFRGPRSRSWLARSAKTYPINITRIENKESMPGAGLISRIAEALEVSVDQLLAPPFKKSSRTA
jgi:uncharacterized protein YijF (DUF1287 family)